LVGLVAKNGTNPTQPGAPVDNSANPAVPGGAGRSC
jgi:hypothetical protein